MERVAPVGDKNAAAQIIAALNREPSESDSYEIQQFRKIDEANIESSRDLRKWLYDKRDGKAPQTILNPHVVVDARTRERIRHLISGLFGKSGQ